MKVRYVNILAEIDMQASMKTPRRISERDSWLKAARKAIPDIPADWNIADYSADLNLVVFHLHNGPAFCTVIIDRKASSLG